MANIHLGDMGAAAAGRQPLPGALRHPRLLATVKLGWILFVLYGLVRLADEPLAAVVFALIIATVALVPAYLWAAGQLPGLPVLPLHALTLAWTFSLPMVAGHPEISNYGPDEYAFSTMCVALYALSATAACLLVSAPRLRPREQFLVLPEGQGFAFFVFAILAGSLFIAAAVGQLISIGAGAFGVLRSAILAFASIALFVLAARWGRGSLTRTQAALFAVAVFFYLLVQLTTVFLVGAIVSVASILVGYTIGRGRVPWAFIVATVVVFSFLHGGKGEMRERYWSGDEKVLTLREVPGFFAEWIAAGAYQITSGESAMAPIHERVSLMHILLMAQRMAPRQVEFLEGETYRIIPRLLVPRLFDPDKPDSHQGTSMLNIHFGVQTPEDTESTTVGWGLLNEGYANFGVPGVIGVGVMLGLLFGAVGRLTAGAPTMSLNSMVGITLCAIAIQAEFTMAVFATVLFQSMIVLVLVRPLLKRKAAGDAA